MTIAISRTAPEEKRSGTLRRICGLKTTTRAFCRDESGVMVIYSVFFFLIMLIIGGIGVDFMHFEMKRTRLQATLDRAVLAAADLQQAQAAEDVIQDYLSKAGLDAVVSGTPTVESSLNFKSVTAGATLKVPTQFIHMLGIDTLSAPAVAGAEESIEGIEISLVLDISNSMNSNNRLINLKPAAREFIDTMMGLTEPGDVTVSIVPYNTQVNAGATLLDHYNVSNEHSYSNCVNFDTADFASPALSTTQSLQRTGHFDIFTYSGGPDLTSTLQIPVCPTWGGTEITVMNTDADQLKNRITALTANGNTSIEIGMKWAAALLDPGTRPVIANMIADGDISSDNAGRPTNYGEPGVLKVIVVMTDGENTKQYVLPDTLRSGLSNVYYNTGTAAASEPRLHRYSIWNAGLNQYFWLRDGTYHLNAYGDHDPATPNDAARLTLPQLSAMNSQATIARDLYTPVIGSGNAWNQWYSSVTTGLQNVAPATKNTRLQSVCSAAKHEGVVIYAIGFEATANGNTQLHDCASSPSHFFNASTTSISDVFQAIAISIAQLRLTQ